MKDQYFGDVNDYRKYGLLRVIQSRNSGRLLVAWMLTRDDGRRDGGFRSYLLNSQAFMRHDPQLFTDLTALLRTAPNPRVSLIERSSILLRTTFYSEFVPDNANERIIWRRGLLNAANAADFVFVDPDNGIEVASKPVGHKNSSKYVAWQEIEDLWQTGCSLIIYQHFCREPRAEFATQIKSRLREHTGARFIEALRTPHVLFLLVAQPRHETLFGETVSFFPQYETSKPEARRWLTQYPGQFVCEN